MNKHAPQLQLIVDPECPNCHRIRVQDYKTMLRAAPQLALRSVEKPCECTPVVLPEPLLLPLLARTVLGCRSFWARGSILILATYHRRRGPERIRP